MSRASRLSSVPMDHTRTGRALAAAGTIILTVSPPLPAEAVCSVFDTRACAPRACSVFDGRACAPAVCSVFDHFPCVPELDFPIGQGLRATFKSAAIEPDPARSITQSTQGDVPAPPRSLGTLRAMFEALRGCWTPPSEDEAWAGMEISVRFAFKRSGEIVGPPAVTYVKRAAPASARESYFNAVRAALERCAPLPFSAGLGGAVAGQPIAIRFIEDRNLQPRRSNHEQSGEHHHSRYHQGQGGHRHAA
jgi:hypothetical protein